MIIWFYLILGFVILIFVLEKIYRKEDLIMATLADLQVKVAENTTVVGSAIILLQGLKQKLDEAIAANDPAAIQALSDEIGTATQALATAVQANTPT
jgi:hypothetical protein